MSGTAVATANATEEERNPSRAWRSHWLARAALPAIYLGLTAGAVAHWGLPYSQDWIFVWLVGLMIAFSVGDGAHTVRRLVRDWLPVFAVLLAYDLIRGVADRGVISTHYSIPVDIDKALGFGQVPTIRLQDALYTPGHIHVWDVAAFGFWFSHFLGPLLVGAALWLFAYRFFHRYVACIVVLAVMGLLTYVLFPAAPPWLAAQHGYIDHTYRINHQVVQWLPIPKADALFQSGTRWSNDVAAVPSLHAAYAMMIALFLWPRVGSRWRPLLAIYAVGMGLSLIYLGEHYLFDVLLGWVYAVATVLVVNWGAERLQQRAKAPPAAAAASKPSGATAR
jgi:membrane-associated phospholipid phosphatase